MKWGPRGALVTLLRNINHTASSRQHCKRRHSSLVKRESSVTGSTAAKANRISVKNIRAPVAVNTANHFSPHLWLRFWNRAKSGSAAVTHAHPQTQTQPGTGGKFSLVKNWVRFQGEEDRRGSPPPQETSSDPALFSKRCLFSFPWKKVGGSAARRY